MSVIYFFDIIECQECDIAKYADDDTLYNLDFRIDNVINNLEKCTKSSLNWFRENDLKAKADKCHFLVSSDKSCTAKIKDFSIEENLLGLKFDTDLSFENQFTSLCRRTSQKLLALARISHYMDLNK